MTLFKNVLFQDKKSFETILNHVPSTFNYDDSWSKGEFCVTFSLWRTVKFHRVLMIIKESRNISRSIISLDHPWQDRPLRMWTAKNHFQKCSHKLNAAILSIARNGLHFEALRRITSHLNYILVLSVQLQCNWWVQSLFLKTLPHGWAINSKNRDISLILLWETQNYMSYYIYCK